MDVAFNFKHGHIFIDDAENTLFLSVQMRLKLGEQFLTIWPASTNLLHSIAISVCK